MDFIQTANKQVDKFGAGKHGFSAGNPSGGIPATNLSPEWCDNIQQELVNVIEGAGITINPASKTQLAQAIQAMISGATGNDYKASVRVATTANIASLAGGAPNTLDGIALVANDRILVKDQTTGSQNGIYVVTTLGTGVNGTWTRATDADATGDLTASSLVVVEEGTAQADTLWMLSTDGPITIGTTAVQFTRRDSGAANTSQLASGSATVASNALTVTLDPATTDFRSATLTSGARTSVTNSSAISLTVPDTATLGTQNGVMTRLAVLEINNAGVKEVAIVNLAGGNNLDETTLISTTAMSAGADSANVIYSQTARSNVAFRVRMLVDVSQAVAGTWASNPTLVQPVGGQAGVSMQSLGYGQTWQNVTGSRTSATNYTNTTGKPIMVCWQLSGSLSPTIQGVNFGTVVGANGGSTPYAWAMIVQPGATYSASIPNGVTGWFELR